MKVDTDAILAWLGLAIAIVALNDFGWGSMIRYTLIAVIVYGLLTNVEKLDALIKRMNAGLRVDARRDPTPANPGYH